MRRTTSFAVVLAMLLALSSPAFGGDMPGPGASQKPPHGNSANVQTATSEPLAWQAGEICSSTGCTEATPDLVSQAMIIAIELLASLY